MDLGFLDFGFPGGCASSRLEHGLKFYVIRGGCASSRLISEFSDCDQAMLAMFCVLQLSSYIWQGLGNDSLGTESDNSSVIRLLAQPPLKG